MKRWLFAVSVVGVCVAVGLAFVLTTRALSADSPTVVSTTKAVPSDLPLPPTNPDLVTTVARMGADPAISASIGAPPEGFKASPDLGAFGTKWLYMTSAVTKLTPELEAKIQWQGFMLAGEIRDQMHGSGDDLLGVDVTAITADGKRHNLGGSLISGPFTHSVDGRSADAQRAEIMDKIAGMTHVVIATVDFLDVNGLAPVVKIETDDPHGFLTPDDGQLGKLVGTLRSKPGFFVEASDTSGQVLVVHGTSYTSQTGVGIPYDQGDALSGARVYP
jgi:hypothetical protein